MFGVGCAASRGADQIEHAELVARVRQEKGPSDLFHFRLPVKKPDIARLLLRVGVASRRDGPGGADRKPASQGDRPDAGCDDLLTLRRRLGGKFGCVGYAASAFSASLKARMKSAAF